MYISELTFTVDRRGSIKIPASVLEKMGLHPGDNIRVAYLTQDGSANTFREFLLLPDTVVAVLAGLLLGGAVAYVTRLWPVAIGAGLGLFGVIT